MFETLIKKRGSEFEEEEDYQPKEDLEALEMCRKCYAFRYENEWHFERPQYLLENDDDTEHETFIQFSLCSDCIEESLAMYDDLEFA
ncbi:hypothetical protein A3A03_02495 [Candidatus Nomurabacteria bacterium RIFCSPLOWO2_01_FULL_40_18]|uniref:Uncharacterized protein n=1 Tax=Candidatus Nomurabacteria bacterium RIFCSPLOWO2_01_FULL_40_18 TaxID=1801773 RepID=A0A1F6XLH4_9BACT|nr:MAG: hypothetical protein A3A03_02495 [Candidatus Nomurabacteria bacterium RIFCSPLOWO2_01_FULL_40_18]